MSTESPATRALSETEKRESRWMAKANAVAAHRAGTGAWPASSSLARETSRLGSWLGQQRQAARAETMDPERRAYLDQVAPGWFGGRERQWLEQADGTVAFYAETGRWPSTAAREASERRLGEWLSHQRSLAKDGSGELTPERRARLDAAMPDWMDPRGDSWSAQARALVAHRAEAGRWPSQVGATEAERHLAMWFSHQRQAARKSSPRLTPGRRALLDDVAPGWFEPMVEPWHDRADALAVFRGRTGRWPSGAAADADERKLGSWLYNQRSRAKAGARWFTPERRAYLDRVAPGWSGA